MPWQGVLLSLLVLAMPSHAHHSSLGHQVMDAIRERTESHLRAIGATVSSKAIVMRCVLLGMRAAADGNSAADQKATCTVKILPGPSMPSVPTSHWWTRLD